MIHLTSLSCRDDRDCSTIEECSGTISSAVDVTDTLREEISPNLVCMMCVQADPTCRSAAAVMPRSGGEASLGAFSSKVSECPRSSREPGVSSSPGTLALSRVDAACRFGGAFHRCWVGHASPRRMVLGRYGTKTDFQAQILSQRLTDGQQL